MFPALCLDTYQERYKDWNRIEYGFSDIIYFPSSSWQTSDLHGFSKVIKRQYNAGRWNRRRQSICNYVWGSSCEIKVDFHPNWVEVGAYAYATYYDHCLPKQSICLPSTIVERFTCLFGTSPPWWLHAEFAHSLLFQPSLGIMNLGVSSPAWVANEW